MPKKIRQLKAMLKKAGFRWRPGKGSHTIWEHPLATKSVTMSGNVGQGRPGREAVSGSRSSGANRRSGPRKAVVSHYSMLIQWSDADEVFIVTLPEFNDAKTHGETYEKAVKMGRQLIESFFMWYAQDGKPLPKPKTLKRSAA